MKKSFKIKSLKVAVKLKIKKLDKSAILPKYAHPGDAGFDLFSTENYLLKPGEQKLFGLGFSYELPPGYFISIRDKSGLAAKHGLHVLGGVADGNYRGELGVILINFGEESYQINKGDKIAQGIIEFAPAANIIEVNSLSQTSRATGGFGSTGKK